MMKKITTLLVLALVLAVSTPLRAQSFDWGVTGGLNMTKLSLKGEMKDNFKSDNQAGWYLGLKAQVNIAMGIGLDASLLYSQSKLYLSDREEGYGEHETSRCIALPVNLRYNIGLGSVASVYLATGPQFDFNIGNKNFGSMLGDAIGIPDADSPSLFGRENMTTSWNIGGGVKLLGHLEANVTYNLAISKLGKAALDMSGVNIPQGDGDLKSNSFKVGLTYYF